MEWTNFSLATILSLEGFLADFGKLHPKNQAIQANIKLLTEFLREAEFQYFKNQREISFRKTREVINKITVMINCSTTSQQRSNWIRKLKEI